MCKIYARLDESHRLNHPELFVQPDEFARDKAYIAEVISNPAKALFVAHIDHIIVGFAECFIQRSSEFPVLREREWVQLDNIAVMEEYHNKKIGSLLFDKIIRWTKDKGISRIELKVYSFNSNAIEFYSGKGFRDLNRTMYLNL